MLCNPKTGLPSALCTAAAARHHLHRPSAAVGPHPPPPISPPPAAGLRPPQIATTASRTTMAKPHQSSFQNRVWPEEFYPTRRGLDRTPDPPAIPPDDSFPASLAGARRWISSLLVAAVAAADSLPGFQAPATADRVPAVGLPQGRTWLAGLDLRSSRSLIWSELQTPLFVTGEDRLEEATNIRIRFWELGFWGKRGILAPALLEKKNFEPWVYLAPVICLWSSLVLAFPDSSPLDPRCFRIPCSWKPLLFGPG